MKIFLCQIGLCLCTCIVLWFPLSIWCQTRCRLAQDVLGFVMIRTQPCCDAWQCTSSERKCQSDQWRAIWILLPSWRCHVIFIKCITVYKTFTTFRRRYLCQYVYCMRARYCDVQDNMRSSKKKKNDINSDMTSNQFHVAVTISVSEKHEFALSFHSLSWADKLANLFPNPMLDMYS